MFIRPYTISQAAMVPLAAFLLAYLQAAVRRGQPRNLSPPAG